MDRDPTGNVKPDLTVIDPFGKRVAHADSWTGYDEEFAQLEYALESTGEFVLQAKDRQSKGTGTATLRFWVNPAVAVSVGESFNSELTLLGEKHFYSFEGQHGQSISIRVNRDATGNVKPKITLIDPFGGIEAQVDSWGAPRDEYAEMNRELKSSGIYVITIEDRQEEGFGSYTMTLSQR
jgi:hypothetical protein